MAISEAKYKDALAQVQRLRSRVTNIRRGAEEQVMQVVGGLEVAGSAFGLSLIEGYCGGVEFLGIPLPVLAGTGLHLAAFGGIAPEHLHQFGNGAFAAYATTLGLGIGEEMRAKGGGGAAAGALGQGGGGLSDAALAMLAQG